MDGVASHESGKLRHTLRHFIPNGSALPSCRPDFHASSEEGRLGVTRRAPRSTAVLSGPNEFIPTFEVVIATMYASLPHGLPRSSGREDEHGSTMLIKEALSTTERSDF